MAGEGSQQAKSGASKKSKSLRSMEVSLRQFFDVSNQSYDPHFDERHPCHRQASVIASLH
jgi:hypothetical protein